MKILGSYPFNKLPPDDPVVIVHSSLKSIGYVIGGAATVVRVLLDWVGESGTLVFPAYSDSVSDPEQWHYPPIAQHLFEKVRRNIPPFDVNLNQIDTGAILNAASRFPVGLCIQTVLS